MAYLMPDRRALIFALKGVISMAMAMYVAMWLDLDRPYWALVSAVFLQVRPETGMVLEKTVCQILGTLLGGTFALIILNFFIAYSGIVLFCLAMWLCLNASLSSLVRRINFIYFFAMAAVTPCIIILLTMATPSMVSSESIFNIAQERVSEIIVGSVCAMLVSLMLWPQRIENVLKQHAQHAINEAMAYLSVELAIDGSHELRHAHIDSTLESLTALNDDSSAVVFEGPTGQRQARAATVICNKILSLVAVVQIFGRLQRNNASLLSANMTTLLQKLREDVALIGSSLDFDECYTLAQQQRRKWRTLFDSNDLTALEYRLCRTAQEMVADLVIILRAYRAMNGGEPSSLKASSLTPYRDPLVALTTGFRTFLVFSIGAGLWIGTGSPAAIMLMILPVIFSIMFARLPSAVVKKSLRGVLIGATVAIPVAIFYALNLIAQSSGDFPVLVMILGVPLFLGLMLLASRPLLPYGLGFCIPFIILVQPGNDMSTSLSVAYTASNALAIMTGLIVLYWVFKLFAGPGMALMQQRLFMVTRKDLIKVGTPHHDVDWFNARMCDRLLRLSSYEKGMAAQGRIITDLALTGLNLGHIIMRIRKMVDSVSTQSLTQLMQAWQWALAESYVLAAQGETPALMNPVYRQIIAALEDQQAPKENIAMIEGVFERINLTFERTATMVRTADTRQEPLVDTRTEN
ncbi:FUSC family protein [Alteromonas sp. C1M14]|nr:FUSC family protein [Alteromonas sp. C1M14]